MNKWTKVALIVVIAGVWMGIIYSLSAMNSKNSNSKSTNIISMFINEMLGVTNEYGITSSHPNDAKLEHASELMNAPLRKVAHASVYFILSVFVLTLLRIIFEQKMYILMIVITLLICFLFALGDEYHQTFVNGRTGQMLDVLIDSTGAFLGILVYSTYYIAYRCGYKKANTEIEVES